MFTREEEKRRESRKDERTHGSGGGTAGLCSGGEAAVRGRWATGAFPDLDPVMIGEEIENDEDWCNNIRKRRDIREVVNGWSWAAARWRRTSQSEATLRGSSATGALPDVRTVCVEEKIQTNADCVINSKEDEETPKIEGPRVGRRSSAARPVSQRRLGLDRHFSTFLPCPGKPSAFVRVVLKENTIIYVVSPGSTSLRPVLGGRYEETRAGAPERDKAFTATG